MKKQNGITLIALVISIIVMLILVGVTINAVMGEEGIIIKTQVASIMSKFSAYKEELELNAIEDMEIYASSEGIKKYIPSMSDKDIEKFVIMKRELLYIENYELEIKAAEACGIGTAQAADETTSNSINEVKAVISGVINLSSNSGDAYKVPEDDFTVTTNTNDSSVGLIGTRLYDKNSINSETWNIVIEYNSANQEIARYGSGYYWLKAGETYIIDGKSMKFENDFVVDYANKTYIALSGRAVNWNLDATLAVSDGLVLNIDPMSLADGEWRQNAEDSNFYDFYVKDNKTGKEENKEIQKTGDVVYDTVAKALKFNEDYTNNPKGEGGYIKLSKSNVNFANGFSFEIYANLSRLEYGEDKTQALGLFGKTYDINSNYNHWMRFGYNGGNESICDFYGDAYTWIGIGKNLYINKNGNVSSANKGYGLNEDFYLTFVYSKYDENRSKEYKNNHPEEYMNGNGNYDEYMDEQYKEGVTIDKVLYYINGNLYGYTYYGNEIYEKGRELWDTDESKFLVGVCNWNNHLYYTKGYIYSTRLYNISMRGEQVKDNYNTTLKYRSSF